MSVITTEDPKPCHKGGQAAAGDNTNWTWRSLFKSKLFITLLLLLVLASLLILWQMRLRSTTKPRFSLTEAAVDRLTISGAPSLSAAVVINSSIRLEILSKNPYHDLAFRYEDMKVYALYAGQLITDDAALPPLYLGPEESVLFPVVSLTGGGLPVTDTSFVSEFQRDQADGLLLLVVRLDGKVKWKGVGNWVISSWSSHGFGVRCEAMMPFGPSFAPSPPVVFGPAGTPCSTTT